MSKKSCTFAGSIAFGNKIAPTDRSALIEATCTSAPPKTSFRAFGDPEKKNAASAFGNKIAQRRNNVITKKKRKTT